MFRGLPAKLLLVLLLSFGLLTGCKHSTEDLGSDVKTYTLRGTVLATDPQTGEVTLQHDAVPGFMEAMTMPYRMANPQGIRELHPGDIIRCRLVVQKTKDGDYRNARIDEIAVIAEKHPNFKPSSDYNVPKAGDVVPDFKLTNQDGKAIHLSQFKGKALLVTFIYTRCPIDDFCPRMSRNFAAIAKSLASDKALQAKSQLLSISFDPAFDGPSVLRSYGKTYTGGDHFEHWQFAAPAKANLQDLEHYFNVGATAGGDNTITHSLSTVLIGPDGKIAAWYPGNEWKPEDVTERIRSLV